MVSRDRSETGEYLEAIGLIFRFEQFLAECKLARFSQVGRNNISALVVWNWFGKEIFIPVRDGGNVDISATVEEMVITAKAGPQIGLQIADRFFQP